MKNLDDLNRHGGLILAVAFVVLQLFDVTTYPLFNIDEPVINDASWQLVTTGQFRADILGLYPGFKDRWLAYPPAQSFAAAICYEFFGIGLWQTRLPSILFGGLGVWSVFAFVRSINPGTIGAWVAALALFFWPDWVLTAKESRMDTGAILALVLATHLSLRALSSPAPPNLHTFLVAGLSASLATVFHTAALLWAFCLVLVVFAFAKERIRSTLAFLVGVSAFGLAWLAYALQSPADFQTQYLSLLVNRSGGGGPLDRLTSEASRYFREFYRLPTFYLVGLFAAYGLVSQRRWTDPKTRALLTLTVLTITVHGFVAGKGSGFYTLYPMTLVFCLVGSGIEALVARRNINRRYRWLPVCTTAVVLIFLANIAAFSVGPRILAHLFQGTERDYARQMEPLSSRLSAGDQVWGTPISWIAVVRAGARLDAVYGLYWKSAREEFQPDPLQHKFVVVDRDSHFPRSENYHKVTAFGAELPRVFGSTLADKPYVFDLWQSNLMK